MLHKSFCIVLHVTQFCNRRQIHYPAYGPGTHVPPMYGLLCMMRFRLSFGPSFSPVICETVLEQLVLQAKLVDVLVVVCYDDIFVLGYGNHHFREHTHRLCMLLEKVEALVSRKSKHFAATNQYTLTSTAAQGGHRGAETGAHRGRRRAWPHKLRPSGVDGNLPAPHQRYHGAQAVLTS